MPLPPSLDRELLHARNIDLRGFRRSDGAFEIEGRVTDIKHHSFQPPGRDAPLPVGVPIHDMSVRLVIDDNMQISEVTAVTDVGPYKDCPEATESLNALRGASIGPGWTARVKGLLGAQSCTHLVELLPRFDRHRRVSDACSRSLHSGRSGERGGQARQDRQLLRICQGPNVSEKTLAGALAAPDSRDERERDATPGVTLRCNYRSSNASATKKSTVNVGSTARSSNTSGTQPTPLASSLESG